MKRLHESVVPWPSWWYERLNSALLGCPLVQLVADELRAVIHAQHSRTATSGGSKIAQQFND